MPPGRRVHNVEDMETLQSAPAPVTASSRTDRWYRESVPSFVRASVIAVVGAAGLGALTGFGQQHLPPEVNSLSNSVGGWTMFCFLLVWAGRSRPLLGAILGAVAFVLLTEAYTLVSGWRGYDDGAHFTSVWTVAGLAAGPLLGASASLLRHGSPLWRALSVTPLSAVLLGEGIWALNTIADTTSPVYWSLEISFSVLVVLAALLRGRLDQRASSLVVSVWLAGTLAYVGVCVGVLN
jgi:hypothetical protein